MKHTHPHAMRIGLFFPLVYGEQFLIFSQPQFAAISYVTLKDKGVAAAPKVLINNALKNPLGLAVDAHSNMLYVSDIEVRKIYRYHLLINDGDIVTDGVQYVAASNVEARWVSVDELGYIFFTEESTQVVKKLAPFNPAYKDARTPKILFTADLSPAVSSPGGIVADARNIFWTNKAEGKSQGVVVHAENLYPPSTSVPKSIAKNINAAYGICMNQNHVFYTAHASSVYVVDKAGGKISTATDTLVAPRGCTWDGDATIFVADKTGNAIYSFPAGHAIAPKTDAKKLFDVEGPFDVAVMTPISAAQSITAYNLVFLRILFI